MNKPVSREGFQPAEPVKTEPAALPPPLSPPPDEDREIWPIKVKLIHKTIRDQDGNELKELTFREPTAGDINRYGNPVLLTNDFEAVIDPKKMTLMMAALSSVLSPMLDKMDPRDWNSCAYRLRTFFLPEPALAW
jgi:hypothetical protein